jgi:DNA-binding NarL/FixJ family response regulator
MVELGDQTRSALAEIRRLVYDLRPSALDSLGLVGALTEHATSITSRADGAPLRLTVQSAGTAVDLPAAVEVAAYRIVTEALTNVTRHSSAGAAVITIAFDADGLQLHVHDDGVNVGRGWQPASVSLRYGNGWRTRRPLHHPARPHRWTGGRHVPAGSGPRTDRWTADMTLRIVLADDHAVVREGLRSLLSAINGYALVGTAATGAEAVRAAVTLRPDVLVMDIQMPDMNGIDATREIRRAAPDVTVLMLTMFDDDESIFAAMRAGAHGYVLKGAEPEDMMRAISAVAAGEVIFGVGVARRALSYLTAPRPAEPAFPELTPREREVLELIAEGKSNSASAARRGLATNTVSNHSLNIFAKLQVASRAEAIVRARTAGLGG